MTKKVLIFFPHQLRERHGGPYSYLFHLKEGLKNLSHSITFLSDTFPVPSESGAAQHSSSVLKKLIKSVLPVKWLNNYRAKKWLKETETDTPAVSAEYINQFDILHFHETIDTWRYRDILENYKGKIVLTSHTPKPYHLELIEDVWKISSGSLSQKLFTQLQEIDQYAFEKKADSFVFACAEAVESYHQLWPEFSKSAKQKQIFYLPTGVKKQIAIKPAEEIRKQFNIPSSAFVFCFTGRKSVVKGFDLLVQAAKDLLTKNTNIYFIVVGRKEQSPAVDSPQWIETGWMDDPQSIIAASDVVVAPNRHTYFDLSVLETLSLGKPLLLSNTGGNKYLKQFQSPGIFYHEPTAESLLHEMINCINQKDNLTQAGLQNEKLYDLYFRCEPFAAGMINLYNRICPNA